MAARNQQLINKTEVFVAKFCQCKRLLPFKYVDIYNDNAIRGFSKSE